VSRETLEAECAQAVSDHGAWPNVLATA